MALLCGSATDFSLHVGALTTHCTAHNMCMLGSTLGTAHAHRVGAALLANDGCLELTNAKGGEARRVRQFNGDTFMLLQEAGYRQHC